MKLYKLTDENMQTFGGFQWTLGKTETALGNGPLCSSAWLHAYTDPLLAVFLNPIHANVKKPRLFETEGKVGKTDRGLKVGCTSLTLTREIDLPNVTPEQRVRFGILCALEVYHDEEFVVWANAWLSGEDRSARSAAMSAARSAARSAAWSARSAAESAAWSAARSAESAAAESAARSAESAAARSAWSAATRSAESAAMSARSAWSESINLPAIAKKALERTNS